MDESTSDPVPLETEPTSLVDEGLRIARQYGLGADFESELEGIKKATTAAATTHEAAGMEETEGSTSSSAWNDGAGMVDHSVEMAADHGAGMADDGAGISDADESRIMT